MVFSIQDDIVYSCFRKNLKRIRLEKGESQFSLSEKAELHFTYISQIERGKRKHISLINAVRLATALGVAVSDFFVDLDQYRYRQS